MLPPTGRIIKQHDRILIKALHKKVNLIPVIAKADTITPAELLVFRESVRKVLADNGIETYDPTDVSQFVHDMPLATVASNECVSIAGETVRVRQYPWGVIEVENPDHSNLAVLRSLLFRCEPLTCFPGLGCTTQQKRPIRCWLLI